MENRNRLLILVKQMSNGKGDTPRPVSVDSYTYKENWERTFGKKPTLSQKRISSSIEELKRDIAELNKKLDERDMHDHYSGLPSTQSYDTTIRTADGNN